jgi:hypothetical protein
MGRAFTFEEAAQKLGRSKRTVHTYVKQGFIRRFADNYGKALLDADDVDQLVKDFGADLPPINKKTVFQLQSRLNKLENQMRMVIEMLELRSDQLRPQPSQASGLYRAASAALGRKGQWSIEEVHQWATLFERIDEETLKIIAISEKEHDSWKPFLALWREMLDYSTMKCEQTKDVHWQENQKSLVIARKMLRDAIVIYGGMNPLVDPTGVGLMESPLEAVLRKFTPKNGK